MKTIPLLLESYFQTLFATALPNLDLTPFFPCPITQTPRPEFGHYQCNLALTLGGALSGQNPRSLAETVVEKGKELKGELIDRLEVAGPGFINVFIEKKELASQLTKMLDDPQLGAFIPPKKERIIVEFSAPNVAKELHVGHLRSTIIGDSLARLFEFLGHDVLRLNHIGDFGTQFGMLISYLWENKQQALSQQEKLSLSSLMQWYREAKKLFDSDPAFKKRAQQQVVRLQAKDPKAVAIWETICAISRKGFDEIYRLLDVKLEERGESFYSPMLFDLVADFEKKGLVTLSDGAKCIFLEGFLRKDGKPLPLILQKSDGGYNYETTDLAALLHRIEVERADRIICVVDAGQKLHFDMVFAAAQQAGYYNPEKTLVKHVPFGVVLGPDGKKFKTRSGQTERLIDLLQAAIDEAKKLLETRLESATSKELDALAEILGIDAVKYADLSGHRAKDYTFSYEKMLRFEGNTAPYLLYCYVRIQSIKRKVGKHLPTVLDTTAIALDHPSEMALGLCLRQFGEALQSMEMSLLPSRLAEYLYGLAEKFHAFFRDCRVEASSFENQRLALCELTGRVLQKGLELLGLKTMPRM